MPSKDKKAVTLHLDPSVVAKIDAMALELAEGDGYYTSRSRVVGMLIHEGLRARSGVGK